MPEEIDPESIDDLADKFDDEFEPIVGIPVSSDGEVDPDMPRLPTQVRFFMLAVAAVLAGVGLVCGLYTAIAFAIVGCVLAAAIVRMTRELHRMKVPPPVTYIGLAGAIGGVALVLMLVYPTWQSQAVTYIINLGEVGSKVVGAIHEVGADFADQGEVLSDAGNVVDEQMTNIGTAAAARLEIPIERRALLFLQFMLVFVAVLLLLIVFVSMVPEVKPVEDGSKSNLSQRFAGWIRRLNTACFMRFLKALLVAGLAGIGFAVATHDTAFFIFGIVLIVALVTRYGPNIGLVLAGLMIPVAASWVWAGVVTFVTLLAMVAAEKRLHWYLVLVPAIKAGGLPREVYARSRQPRSSRRILRWVLWPIELILLLAVFAVVGYVVLFVFNNNTAVTQRKYTINAVAALPEERVSEVVPMYLQLLKTDANDRIVRMELVKAYCATGDYVAAVDQAINVAEWKLTHPGDSWRARLDGKLLDLLQMQSVTNYDPMEGYVFVLEHVGEQPSDADLLSIADTLVLVEPGSVVAHLYAARRALVAEANAAAVSWADRGLSLDVGFEGLNSVKARAYAALGETEGALAACAAELEVDPDNEVMQKLQTDLRADQRPKETIDEP
jgi:hypothetical protein